MKLSKWILSATLVCFLAIAVCSQGKDGSTTSTSGPASSSATSTSGPAAVQVKQGTVKEAVETFCVAMTKLDTDAAVATMHPGYSKVMALYMTAGKQAYVQEEELAKAVEDKIGKDEAKAIRDKTAEGLKRIPYVKFVKDGKVDWSGIEFKETGDNAAVTFPDEGAPLLLVRLLGKWYIMPPGQDNVPSAEEMDKMMASMKDAVAKRAANRDALIAQIKAGKVTKDTLEAELNRQP